MPLPPHDFVAWREGQTTFVDLAAYVEALFLLESADGFPREHWGVAITPQAFDLLGVEALHGRTFVADEALAGAVEVVLLGHRLWQAEFGSDPAIVGSEVQINGLPTTVVGIMPPEFGFPLVEQLWRPLRVDLAEHERGGGRLDAFGRLRSGVSIQQARADIGAVGASLAAEFPETNEGVEPRLGSFVEEYVGEEFTARVWAMLLAAVMVLALSCLNITSLLVARASSRGAELAVRVALGAGRIRIARQLLVETVLLTAAGGIAGLALAALGLRLIARFWAGTTIFQLPHGPDAPSWWAFQVDSTVVLFCGAVTLVSALLAGLAPLWHLRRADLHGVLRSQRGAASSPASRRWANWVVVGEMALCTALVISAGLVVRSYSNLDGVAQSLDFAGLQAARVSLPTTTIFDGSGGVVPTQHRYDDLESRLGLWDALSTALDASPDVAAHTLGSALPVSGSHRTRFTLVETDADADIPTARYATVADNYFDVLGAAALSGRIFGQRDQDLVAVVNAPFAARYFPSGALNQRLRLGRPGDSSPWLRVVGVVPDLRMNGVGGREPEGIYVPLRQSTVNGASLSLSFNRVILRSRGSSAEVERALRRIVAGLDDRAPVSMFESVESLAGRGAQRFRVHGSFYLLLGGVAILLAGVGLYGVLAQTVGRRRAEIGTRIALGADASSVAGLVVRQALAQVGTGTLIGLVLAAWLQPRLEQILYEVRPWDAATLGALVAVLLVMAAGASLVPARRAVRVDPVKAMRAE